MSGPLGGSPRFGGWRWWLFVAAIVLVAVNLRATIAGVGPLLAEIRDGVGLSGTGAGVLTTLPVLCFGALAPLAPSLARRWGSDAVVGGAMLVLTLGIVVRSSPSLAALFAGSVLIGGAIAVANVLLPSIVKRDSGSQAGMVLGLYAMSMGLGAAVAAGLVVPVHDALGVGWRAALLLVLPMALLALVLWTLTIRKGRAAADEVPSGAPKVTAREGLWRDPVAWAVTIFMGATSLQFYATFAWFPTILVDEGGGAQTAGWWLALMGLTGALGSLIVPPLAARARAQGRFVVLIAGLYVVGWVGMLIAPVAGGAAWAALLGLAQGAGISLALTLMVVRAPDAPRAADLSGMVQTVGYLIAATGPLLLGTAHDLMGGWRGPMVMMLALLVPLLIAGLAAGRPRLVNTRPR